MLKDIEERKSIIHVMGKLPRCVLRWWVRSRLTKELTNPKIKKMPYYSPEEIEANAYYLYLMHHRHSVMEVVSALPFVPMGFGRHSIAGPDRLGSPNINFPIGVCYGDSDFFGSEGACEIIRNSKHFETGRS